MAFSAARQLVEARPVTLSFAPVAGPEQDRQHEATFSIWTKDSRNPFVRRAGLACFRATACFRAVYDDFASEAELADVAAGAPTAAEVAASSTSYAINTWTWATPPERAAWRGLQARVRRLLIERHGVPDSVVFYRTNIITRSAPRRSAEARHPAAFGVASLHSDFRTDNLFVYTAVLYVVTHADEACAGGEACAGRVVGGETGIADAVAADAPAAVTAGLRVEPRRARLLVFSSGAENLHAPLPLLAGARVVSQLWCAPGRGRGPGLNMPIVCVCVGGGWFRKLRAHGSFACEGLGYSAHGRGWIMPICCGRVVQETPNAQAHGRFACEGMAAGWAKGLRDDEGVADLRRGL
jgi:hypothetical protein